MSILKRLTGRQEKPEAEPQASKRRTINKGEAEERLRKNSPGLFDDGPGRRGKQNKP